MKKRRVFLREPRLWVAVAALSLVAIGAQARFALRALRARVVSARAVERTVTAIPSGSRAPSPTANPSRLITHLLIDAIIQVESAGDPLSVGRAGERGLMQIKRPTWEQVTAELFGRPLSFEKAFDAAINRRVGSGYLAELQRFLLRHRERWQADERSLLLASYNAGPMRVWKAGFDLSRLPERTKDYVNRVSALHDLYLGRIDIQVPDLARLQRERGRERAAVRVGS